MATDLLLPLLGDVMTEGRLVSWLQPDGATVEAGQALYELESEKVSATVEAPSAGVLRHLVDEGEVMAVGSLVGRLLAPGEEEVEDAGAAPPGPARNAAPGEATAGGAETRRDGAPAEPAARAPGKGQAAVTAAPPPAATVAAASPGAGGAPVLATPAARRLARQLGLDLSALPKGRRLREADVRAFHAAQAEPAQAEAEAVPAAREPAPAPEPESGPVAAPAAWAAADGAVGYTGRRRAVGENMLRSLAGSAQLTLTTETGVDAAMEMVDGLNEEWSAAGVVVTLTRLVVKACAVALKEHPTFNARLDGDRIVQLPEVNVGIAMDHESGLVVPVVHGVDALSLKQLSRIGRELTLKGRDGRLTVADTEGATFTVTSMASTVVDAFTPIINPPQAAILGVGRVREVAAFAGETVVRRRVTTLSLTFDHRLNDGSPSARFLGRVAELIGRPYLLM
jgi:pyruvate dehydrogenase E2 component (dihydrolipoyllysine-residue acetyltransferase)